MKVLLTSVPAVQDASVCVHYAMRSQEFQQSSLNDATRHMYKKLRERHSRRAMPVHTRHKLVRIAFDSYGMAGTWCVCDSTMLQQFKNSCIMLTCSGRASMLMISSCCSNLTRTHAIGGWINVRWAEQP